MRINKNSPVPLYRQIEQAIEEKMNKEGWGTGYKLPTEKELAKYFKVSAITVKRGIHELVNRGLLYRERGRGTFVSAREEKNINKMVTFNNNDGEKKEYPHKTVKFEVRTVGKELGKLINIDPREEIYSIERIKLDHDYPVSLEYTYIPTKKVTGLKPNMLEEDLIYHVFKEKYQLKLKKAKIYISTMNAREKESEILGVPIGSQLFVLTRHTFDVDKDLIEYSRFIVKQDKFNYYIEINL